MGRYSGILLCSDFDGTMYNGKVIPEENMKAIRHFRENGGLFTVTSGRSKGFFNPFFEGYCFGVPLIHLNGAVLYDMDNDRVIREKLMSGMSKKLVVRLAKEVPGAIRVGFFPRNATALVPVEEINDISCELARDIYKLVIHLNHKDPEKSNEAVAAINEITEGKFVTARSSWGYIEIIDPETSKSEATHFLKDYVGADTLVCVGDFENDIDMVRDADIGYAVANAVDSVKKVAKRHTVSVHEAAIARIVEEM